MRCAFFLLPLLILTAGCHQRLRQNPDDQPKVTPAQPHPTLKPIELRSGIYLARSEIHVTISPQGQLRSVRIDNKTYGPKDQHGPEHVTIQEGQLTPQQINELERLFAGWDKLEDHYTGVPDDVAIQIRYGEKSVACGGTACPNQVLNVQQRIRELADSMPQVKD